MNNGKRVGETGLGGGRKAAGQSAAQKKEARLRKAKARAEEQRKKLLKSGVALPPAKDEYDLSALEGPNRFTFRSSEYWQQHKASIEERITKEHFNAEVSTETMNQLIEETARNYASLVIERASEDSTPSMAELWMTIFRKRDSNEPEYRINDWVEFLDDDMEWKLGKVLRSFKGFHDRGEEGEQIEYLKDLSEEEDENVEKEENDEYFYEVEGCGKSLTSKELRCSEEGLVKLFGRGPWIWQQHALLRLEKKLRIQENHPDDFESISILEFAEDNWNRWVEDERNHHFSDTYNHPRVTDEGRESLRKHIFAPFQIIAQICEYDEGWDPANSSDFGVFSYCNFFGSGMIIPTIVMIIQWVLPILLLVSNFKDVKKKELISLDTYFCVQDDAASKIAKKLTTIMVIMIQLLYTTQIVIDRFIAFASSLGIDLGFGTYDVFYRYKALRGLVRERRYESALQSVGYTLDGVMNTLYVCFLYMVNVQNIIQAADPFEVLLNALALEFVGQIDEEFANSKWWDNERRWIRAVGVSTVLQAYIEKHTMKSAELFWRRFNDEIIVDKDDRKGILEEGLSIHDLRDSLGEKLKKDAKFLKDKEVAKEDASKIEYMTPSDRVEFDIECFALESQVPEATEYVVKKRVYFGEIDHFFLGDAVRPLFWRFEDYRTWSLWDSILYCARTSDLDTKGDTKNPEKHNTAIFSLRKSAKLEFGQFWEEYEPNAKLGIKFLNWDPDAARKNPVKKAARTICRTLFFVELFEKIEESFEAKKYKDIPFWIYDAAFEWLSYFIQIIFPIYIIFGLFYSIAHCYNAVE